jgi:acyl transferase domain-containing protein
LVVMDVAIIGIAMRFPGAGDIHTFWENTRLARDLVVEIPKDRWDWRHYYGNAREERNKTASKWGAYVSDADKFDPLFFGISPQEALLMDPQQRIMLELTWSCLEDAGYPAADLSGKQIGVFVGACNFDYKELQERYRDTVEAHTATGTYNTMLSNRISYCYNFLGPSLTVDTACSSSLVALHLACASLRESECDMALVGGVSILATPTSYISFSKAGMLSPRGVCRTLDADADGYVRGEGAALVALKPLEKAIAANDHIYGIVKATACNHGGKVRTLTSPSAFSQSRVIAEACRKGRVDPKTLGYIELHGTGTRLGDPIEIQGLKRAFSQLLKKSGGERESHYCALGAVKTHIGHLEAAAGMAGLIIVLMAMQERTLPPIKNLTAVNPKIDLEETPFYFVTQPTQWQRTVDESGNSLPYRAGVSSFGFGGSNSHVIVEEYVSSESAPCGVGESSHYLIPLSSTSARDLRRFAVDLLSFLTHQVNHRSGDRRRGEIQEIAYTLQLRREAMACRVAFIVRDEKELANKLAAYVAGNTAGESQGCFAANPAAAALVGEAPFGGDGDLHVADDPGLSSLTSMAKAWVAGETVDMRTLYADRLPRMLALPGHVFDRSSYWIDTTSARDLPVDTDSDFPALLRSPTPEGATPGRHELTLKLLGSEWFLRDHRIAGRAMLPAAAYIALVRRAFQLIEGEKSRSGASDRQADAVEIRDMTWLQPVTGDAPSSLAIELDEQGAGHCAFRIYSDKDGAEHGGRRLHVLGAIGFSSEKIRDSLGAHHSGPFSVDLDMPAWYRSLARAGYVYGESMQAVEALMRGGIGRGTVLARLRSAAARPSRPESLLRPELLDAALQTSLVLLLEGRESEASSQALVPFSINRIVIERDLDSSAWARAERVEGKHAACDLALYDKDGKACISFSGVDYRPLQDARSDPTRVAASRGWTLLPIWDAVGGPAREETRNDEAVLLVGGNESIRRSLAARFGRLTVCEPDQEDSIEVIADRLRQESFDHIVYCFSPCPVLSPSVSDLEYLRERLYASMLGIFRLVKAVLLLGKGLEALKWTVITVRSVKVHEELMPGPCEAGVHAFMRSAAHEIPHWRITQVDVEDLDMDANLAARIFSMPMRMHERGTVWAHRDSQWYQLKLLPVEIADEATVKSPYRTRGVYVVIGGAGGIGTQWSRYLIEHYQANVIWIGRREKDPVIAARIESLSRYGSPPEYYSVDGGNALAVKTLVEEIKAKHGAIHGIVNSAIVLADQSLGRMDEEQFLSVLGAKADTGIALAALADAGFSPDFLLVFSSLNSFTAPAGQSNYAAASAFIDALFHWLSQHTCYPCKTINWGYWGGTGIVASAEYRERMQRKGYESVDAEAAMPALESFLAADMPQAAFVKTNVPIGDLDEQILPFDSVRALAGAIPSGISAVARALGRDADGAAGSDHRAAAAGT